MSARERILGRLNRCAARRPPPAPEHATASDAPLDSATEPDAGRRFVERARHLGSEVLALERLDAAPAAVARWLEERGLPRRGAVWPALAGLAWDRAGIALAARAAQADDPIGVTGVFAAIAETGTLMLLSGAGTPASVSLLPETHVALLRREQIVPTMEAAFARMRARHGDVPRAINFVSGPSRTADVEQTITVGAHGPRRVLIVLADA